MDFRADQRVSDYLRPRGIAVPLSYLSASLFLGSLGATVVHMISHLVLGVIYRTQQFTVFS